MGKVINECIEKWEKYYSRKHKASIDLTPNKTLPYYDQQFVEDLMKKVEKQASTIEKLMANEREYLSMLRGF